MGTEHEEIKKQLDQARELIDFSELWDDPQEGGMLEKMAPIAMLVLQFITLVALFFMRK